MPRIPDPTRLRCHDSMSSHPFRCRGCTPPNAPHATRVSLTFPFLTFILDPSVAQASVKCSATCSGTTVSATLFASSMLRPPFPSASTFCSSLSMAAAICPFGVLITTWSVPFSNASHLTNTLATGSRVSSSSAICACPVPATPCHVPGPERSSFPVSHLSCRSDRPAGTTELSCA